MTLRTTLFIQDKVIPRSLQSALKQAGWTALHVADLGQIPTVLAKHSVEVGLLDHESKIANQFWQVDWPELKAQYRFPWLALFKNKNQAKMAFKKLEQPNFVDVHIGPLQAEPLIYSLDHAADLAKLQQMHCQQNPSTQTCQHALLGESPCMKTLRSQCVKAAQVLAPVLITGESGTGKELAAHTIHEHSSRTARPLVVVNCGALPKDLVYSELFGYEKGAFTGAMKRKLGFIEAADKGSLFLDEIGELPLDQQVHLLRFLQTGRIRRLGATQETQLDVRVIAATNRQLKEAIATGHFRDDLFYRLNVINITTPALHEHLEDLPILAQHYLNCFQHEAQPLLKGLTPAAMAAMQEYQWPGNVREFINRLRRGMAMSEGELITTSDLGIERRSVKRHIINLDHARADAERDVIVRALRANNENITEVAKMLGITRVKLYRLIEKYNLDG